MYTRRKLFRSHRGRKSRRHRNRRHRKMRGGANITEPNELMVGEKYNLNFPSVPNSKDSDMYQQEFSQKYNGQYFYIGSFSTQYDTNKNENVYEFVGGNNCEKIQLYKSPLRSPRSAFFATVDDGGMLMLVSRGASIDAFENIREIYNLDCDVSKI